jgi:hypothetical protein
MPEPESHPTKPSPRLTSALHLTALALWMFSFALPVWDTQSQARSETAYGYQVAAAGWAGILVLCPAWFANLLLIPIHKTWAQGRTAFWLSALALIIASTAYTISAFHGATPSAIIVARKIGFYTWLASFFLMLIADSFPIDKNDEPPAPIRWSTVAILLAGIITLHFVLPVGVNILHSPAPAPTSAPTTIPETSHPSPLTKPAQK